MLSTAEEAHVVIPALLAGKDLDTAITRTDFERLCGDLFDKCSALAERLLQQARIVAADLSEVVLVGGSARMPGVQRALLSVFHVTPVAPDPGAAAGRGACAAAIGACMQAGIMAAAPGALQNMLQLGVLPRSLGIKPASGELYVVMRNNSVVPAHSEVSLPLVEDNQPVANVESFEGNSKSADANRFLARLILPLGLGPRSEARIHSQFDIDANGRLTVCAADARGNERRCITAYSHNICGLPCGLASSSSIGA